MPGLFARLTGRPSRAPSESKQSRTAAIFSMGFPTARPQPREATELVRQGYERNPIVFRSVRMIAESVASVPWLVYEQGQERADHPLMALLRAPGGSRSGVELIDILVTDLLLFGNAYVEAVALDGVHREWHALRPDRMSIVPAANGWPLAYEYAVRFPVADHAILHLKLFSPLDDHYGLSPLAAAETALDTHNAAGMWNRALLENAARPSGALVYAGPEGASLSDEQFERLKSELDESFSGLRNAGRPLLLEGGLDWKTLSLTPKELDFIEAKAGAAREIALALGVPPLVLGLPGDNTFSNYQEANRAFWRQTILPFVHRLQAAFNTWLAPTYGAIEWRANLDAIDALASERAAEWTRVGNADFLTRDEKREAVGYGPMQSSTKG
jgi:HK97 family phage portal protein